MKAGNLPCRRLPLALLFLRLLGGELMKNDVSGCCIVRRQSGRRAGAAAKCIQPGADQIRSGSPGFGTGSATRRS